MDVKLRGATRSGVKAVREAWGGVCSRTDTGVPGPPPPVTSQEQDFPSLLPDWRRPVAPPPCLIPAGVLFCSREGASVREALTLCRAEEYRGMRSMLRGRPGEELAGPGVKEGSGLGGQRTRRLRD